jgi:hypothetical protein
VEGAFSVGVFEWGGFAGLVGAVAGGAGGVFVRHEV